MSFRGRGGRGGGGGFRGGRGGGGFRGGRGGGQDRGGRGYDQGPPESVTALGRFSWTVQDDLVAKVDIEQVPYFNAPIYMENKQQVGKIDEIFGNIRDYYVSIRLSENVKASSFQKDMQLFIDPAKLLPLQRFLPKAPGSIQKRGGINKLGGGRGGRGGPRGGRGGVGRGGFSRGAFARGGSGGMGGAGRGFSRGGRGSGNGFQSRGSGGGAGGGGSFRGRGRGRW